MLTNKRGGRDDHVDSLKYCLMVLVIIGHVFAQTQFTSIPACTVVFKWIYIFHMPLFVFISGYFSHKKDNKLFFSSCWTLIEPLIVFQIFFLCYDYYSSGTLSFREILTPWWVLWYLLSLLYWRLMLQIIPDKVLSNTKLLIIIGFSISLLAGFMPFNRMLSLQRTLAFMPFFFLGYTMRGKDLFVLSKYRVWCVLFLILTMMLPFFFSGYLGDLNQADPYSTIYGVCSRALVFGLSIPMSIAFINICPNIPWLAKQGRLTMQYYIYHAIIIFLGMKIVIRFNLPTSFVYAVIYTIGIIIGIGLVLKFRFFVKLTNPSSFF